jgi:hypothetical protein
MAKLLLSHPLAAPRSPSLTVLGHAPDVAHLTNKNKNRCFIGNSLLKMDMATPASVGMPFVPLFRLSSGMTDYWKLSTGSAHSHIMLYIQHASHSAKLPVLSSRGCAYGSFPL